MKPTEILKNEHKAILYPIADARLSPQTQTQLERDFERVEEEIVGAGRHEEYPRLLERLEKTYG